MVDRLEIIPGDVRGGGNITIPKNFTEDKNTNVYSTFLSENQAEIDGRWMPTFHSYYSNWYQLTVESDAPRIVSPGEDASFNVTVSNPARENVNGVHVDVSLRSKDGENEYWASSFVIMDNQPSFTLWIPEDCDKYCEWFIHATPGWYNGVGLHRSVIVADVTDVTFDAFSDKQIIQTGETCNVIGLLTGKLGESVIGIPGQTVNFYETFTPGLKVDAIPEIIQVGEQSCITTQLIDTTDGSLVRQDGVNIDLYAENLPLVPSSLDVSVDKTVLSYADSDAAHLTLTLYDQFSNPLAGEYIEFTVDGEFEYRFLTNSDGQVVLNHQSAGVGDVVLGFECGNVTETVTIEDCWNAHLSEISITGDTVNSIGMDNVHNVQNDDFILEFDHKGNGNICIGATSQYSTPSTADYRLTLGTYDSKYYCAVRTSSTDETSGSSEDNSTYYSYKIEKEGTTVKFYANNVLIATKTASFFTNYDAYSIYNIKWGGGTDYVKNIRLKPL